MLFGPTLLDTDDESEGAEIIPVISDGEDHFELQESETENIPILPLRNVVL